MGSLLGLPYTPGETPTPTPFPRLLGEVGLPLEKPPPDELLGEVLAPGMLVAPGACWEEGEACGMSAGEGMAVPTDCWGETPALDMA
jgi:hypothetical protein